MSTELTYDMWNAARREAYPSEGNYEEVSVQHNEYESFLFYAQTGRTVATWLQSTGRCNITPRADGIAALAASVNNYLTNSLREAS